jgi:hypothetical protein
MVKKAFNIFLPGNLAKKPIMFLAAKKNNVILNVVIAKVLQSGGEATIELEGTKKDIEKTINEMEAEGVKIEPATGDIY